MSDGHDARRRALMRALAGTGLLAAAAPMPILGAQRGPYKRN